MEKNPNLKVIVNWRRVDGKPSSAWQQLWEKLLANRRRKPAGSRDAGKKGSGNDDATA